MDVVFQTSFSICMQLVFCVCGLIKHALKVQTRYKEMSTHFEGFFLIILTCESNNMRLIK